MPIWDELLLESFVPQFFCHLFPEVGFCFVVDVCVLEEDAELAIEASLDALAVLEKYTGLSGEF